MIYSHINYYIGRFSFSIPKTIKFMAREVVESTYIKPIFIKSQKAENRLFYLKSVLKSAFSKFSFVIASGITKATQNYLGSSSFDQPSGQKIDSKFGYTVYYTVYYMKIHHMVKIHHYSEF